MSVVAAAFIFGVGAALWIGLLKVLVVDSYLTWRRYR